LEIEMEEVLIPLAGIAMIVAIVLGPGFIRARTREKMLETMRIAYERGQPVPPELIEAINADPRDTRPVKAPVDRAERDLRSGIITLAVALAFVVFGFALSFEESDAFYPMIGIAAFPGFIGLALIVFGLIGRRRKDSF
jgi:hypothetical protein